MEKVSIELENVELSYLDREILNIERLAVHQFDRIGIVGKNGAGKSTVLKLMHGQIEPDKGHVRRFIDTAYFDQLSTADNRDIAHELKGKLSIPETEISHFSGGEQTRLKLAQIFSAWHEGLFMDEPTTHLDAEGIRFFIEELTHYYGALIIVSHDRHVLDQLVTKIWEIEGGNVIAYTGNYSDYITQKELQKRQQQEQHEMYLKEKTRLMNAADEKMRKAEKITRPSGNMSKKEAKAKANKMYMTKSKGTSQKSVQRTAKALEQRVAQLEEVDAPKEEQVLHFPQSENLKLHNKFPIMADRLNLKAGETQLLSEVSFQFQLGKTIAITGDNGSGKTTLLRHILQDGEGITMSPKAVIGSYEQMGYQFEKEESVLAYMRDRSDHKESRIRAVLHAMNFTGNDVKKDVRELSGGEAIRLNLCRLFLGRYNILILDEPTNFLDVFSIEALERFIQAYEGTVLLVSHDQLFVERVADEVYVIKEKKLK